MVDTIHSVHRMKSKDPLDLTITVTEESSLMVCNNVNAQKYLHLNTPSPSCYKRFLRTALQILFLKFYYHFTKLNSF